MTKKINYTDYLEEENRNYQDSLLFSPSNEKENENNDNNKEYFPINEGNSQVFQNQNERNISNNYDKDEILNDIKCDINKEKHDELNNQSLIDEKTYINTPEKQNKKIVKEEKEEERKEESKEKKEIENKDEKEKKENKNEKEKEVKFIEINNSLLSDNEFFNNLIDQQEENNANSQLKITGYNEITKSLKKTKLNENLKLKLAKPTCRAIEYYEKLKARFMNTKPDENKEMNKEFSILGKKRLLINEEKEPPCHDKYFPPNIIKRIKHFIFKFILLFLNICLEPNLKNAPYFNDFEDIQTIKEKDFKFKEYDYKSVIQDLKKDKNLNYLNMKLKKLFSEYEINTKDKKNKINHKKKETNQKKEISPKKEQDNDDWNKKIIDKIDKNEDNDTIIKSALNLTFREWLDIFTYKKELRDYISLDNESIKKMEESFKRVDTFLNEEFKEENEFDETYFQIFVLYIYNYEVFFYNIIGRASRKKE